MGREPLDSASQAFFQRMLEPGQTKEAADLSPETEEILGIQNADPDSLDQLEAAAGGEPPKDVNAATETLHPAPEEATPTLHPAPRGANIRKPTDEEAVAQSELEQHAPHLIDASPRPPAEDSELVEELDDGEGAPGVDEPSRRSHGRIFSARRTHPMRLFDVLQAKYGDDWLHWEPETLWWAIRRDFGPVGELTRNKLQALRTAAKSYSPWDDWDVFENCGLAWNDLIPIFGAYQPMTPSQTAFTTQIMKELHPEAPWGHEVAAYQAAVLDDAGFVFAPEEWFPDAQSLLDRNVEVTGMKVEVARAWEQLRDKDLGDVEWRSDNPVDISVAKLLVVKTYLNERAALRNGDAGDERPTVPSTPTSPPVPQ